MASFSSTFKVRVSKSNVMANPGGFVSDKSRRLRLGPAAFTMVVFLEQTGG